MNKETAQEYLECLRDEGLLAFIRLTEMKEEKDQYLNFLIKEDPGPEKPKVDLIEEYISILAEDNNE